MAVVLSRWANGLAIGNLIENWILYLLQDEYIKGIDLYVYDVILCIHILHVYVYCY